MLKRTVRKGPNCLQSQWLKTSKLCEAFRLAQQQCVETFLNGFPWLSSCIQALHHQMQCKASDAVVKSTPPLDT
ncbi:unnamed protein product, partial [Staurois parvus]